MKPRRSASHGKIRGIRVDLRSVILKIRAIRVP
jgi:hypothetical protein